MSKLLAISGLGQGALIGMPDIRQQPRRQPNRALISIHGNKVKSSQGLLFSEARKPRAEAAGHGRRGRCARVWSPPPPGQGNINRGNYSRFSVTFKGEAHASFARKRTHVWTDIRWALRFHQGPLRPINRHHRRLVSAQAGPALQPPQAIQHTAGDQEEKRSAALVISDNIILRTKKYS